MEIKGEFVALALSGVPIRIEQCNIAITQPKVIDVIMFGEDQFLFNVQLLSKTDHFVQQIKRDNPELEIISDFNILLTMINQDKETKKNIEDFFNFIFPEYNVLITQTEINFKIEDSTVGQINPINFKEFQSILRLLFLPQNNKEGELEYNPEGEKAKIITEKILAGRRKIQKQRQQEDQKHSLFAMYTSVLSIGLKMDINIFMNNYTPFQLYDALNRFFRKNADDYFNRISTTPFMDTSQMEPPPSWVDDLY